MTVQENEQGSAGTANVPATSGSVPPADNKLAEIQCPACDARYRVPVAALGDSGRRVQCASCGEVWHATATTAPEPKQEPEATQADDDAAANAEAAAQGSGRQRRSWRDHQADMQAAAEAEAKAEEESAQVDAADAAPSSDSFAQRLAKIRGTPAAGSATPAAEPTASAEPSTAPADPDPALGTAPETAAAAPEEPREKRDEQMAEIRRMLDDLKGDDSERGTGDLGISIASPPPTEAVMKERDVAGIEKMAPAPEAPAAYADPLREKLLDADTKARRNSDPDAARAGLMRRHQKRSRRRQQAAESRKSRSGFYTGLVLVGAVVAMLAGVYIFADKLGERMPEARGALAEYKQTIDGALAQGQAALGRVRERVDDVIEEVQDDQ